LIWWLVLDGSQGGCNMRHWWLWSPWMCIFSASGPWWSQNSFSNTFPIDASMQNFFGFCELECCHSLLAFFISGSSNWPRFHLQPLCASGSHHLFCIITKVAMHAAKGFFSSRGMQALMKHWRTCTECSRGCVEKWQSYTELICNKLASKKNLRFSFDSPFYIIYTKWVISYHVAQ
jgi:hypothetical protein